MHPPQGPHSPSHRIPDFTFTGVSARRDQSNLPFVPIFAAFGVIVSFATVLGLKVRPKTATVLPRNTPAKLEDTLRAMARLRVSLTVSTASRIRMGRS